MDGVDVYRGRNWFVVKDSRDGVVARDRAVFRCPSPSLCNVTMGLRDEVCCQFWETGVEWIDVDFSCGEQPYLQSRSNRVIRPNLG